MLDDLNILQKYDPKSFLARISDEYLQATTKLSLHCPDHDHREIRSIVVSVMGTSGISAQIVKNWLSSHLTIPFEIIQEPTLPAAVAPHTLFIALSFSGETSEVLSTLEFAQSTSSQIAIITSGGPLLKTATASDIAHVKLPKKLHPQFSTIAEVKALTLLLAHFDLVTPAHLDEITALKSSLKSASESWSNFSDLSENHAKQFAILAHNHMNMLFSSCALVPVIHRWAYLWNIADQRTFYERLPSASHHEAPDAEVFTTIHVTSSLDTLHTVDTFLAHTKTLKKHKTSPLTISLHGETFLAQALWGVILGDFIAIYLATLNKTKFRP
ncbi:SIS domain-containing protein [Candidatus Saccharibacteria bacterium]|nr:SIS domain-containing protein [Candidatus Saccharibacteria bacterium]